MNAGLYSYRVLYYGMAFPHETGRTRDVQKTGCGAPFCCMSAQRASIAAAASVGGWMLGRPYASQTPDLPL